jgi:hypothetical protein
MELKPEFTFTPIPEITRPLRFSAAGTSESPLGPLEGLKGTWTGTGFNVIWRPFQGATKPGSLPRTQSHSRDFEI